MLRCDDLAAGDVLTFHVSGTDVVATYSLRGDGMEFAGWIAQSSVCIVLGSHRDGWSVWTIVLFSRGIRLLGPVSIPYARKIT